mgnify:CR=1 FL=1
MAEKITKIDSTKISVTKDATEYSKEFVDNQVALCQATVTNATAELNYWLNLQSKF